MTMFDLLLIGLTLASIAILSFAVICFTRGQRQRGMEVVRAIALGAAIYFGIVIAVSLILPSRAVSIGEPLCFDDGCITVEGVERIGSQANTAIFVTLRFFNRAWRIISVQSTSGRSRTTLNGEIVSTVRDIPVVH
jgi:hypothetical protein